MYEQIKGKPASFFISLILIASMILGMLPAYALTGTVNVDPPEDEISISSWDELVTQFSSDGTTIVIPEGTVVEINDSIDVPASGNYTITGGTFKWGTSTLQGTKFTVNNSTLNLSNVTLDGTACKDAGIIIEAGTVNIQDTVIENFGIEKEDISVMSLYDNAEVNLGAGTIIRDNITARNSISSTKSIININGATIANNTCKAGSIISGFTNSTINIIDGNIYENKHNSTIENTMGTIAVVYNSCLNIYGGTITKNTSDQDAGAIFVQSNSTLTMTSGTISENQANNNGGAIFVSEGSTANITGGTIENNSAKDGAGINCSSSTLILGNETGGPTITKNKTNSTSDASGGGISISYNSVLNINNSTISYNEASDGAGIEIWSNQVTGYIKNSNIENNIATGTGGGINNSFGANIEISDCNILNNSANSGGGVYGSNLTLKNTFVTNNTATYEGGGLGDANGISNYKIQDSEITNNSAGRKGGGVLAEKDITISGKVIINNNSSESNNKDNMFINFYEEEENTGITVEGPLSDDSKIGVSFNNPIEGTLVAKPAAEYTLTDSDRAKFFEDTATFNIVDDNSTGVKNFVLGEEIQKHKIEGSVTNKKYEPLSNVKIQIFDSDNNEIGNSLSDENGHFEFLELIDGDYKIVATYEDSEGSVTGEANVSLNGQDEIVDIILNLSNRNHKVYGTITNSTTKDPLPGATVEIKNSDGSKAGETTTKEDGTYEIPNLPDGSYTLTVSYPDPTNPDMDITKDVPVTINGRDEQVDVELDIPTGTFKISGTVTFKGTDEPVALADIQLKDSEGNLIEAVKTDNQGKYEFTNLAEGIYKVAAFYNGSADIVEVVSDETQGEGDLNEG